MDEQMYGWTDVWMDRCMDGQMYGWTDMVPLYALLSVCKWQRNYNISYLF